MTVQGNDLEQWQIKEQNPDESWKSYSQSTSRTPKKLLIILAITLTLGGIAFVVGRFLAGQSADEATPTTTSPETTIVEIEDVNSLLNAMALRLNDSPTEPYLAVQIYDSDIGVLGQVATAEERDQIVSILEETFTSELDPDAITIDADLDTVAWVDDIQPAIDAFSKEPILGNGFGINNSELILDAELPQPDSQQTLVEAFSTLDLELVDESLVINRSQTAAVQVSLDNEELLITGTVPSAGVASQIEASAISVYGDAVETELEVSDAAFASLQFGQIGTELSLSGVFETFELVIDDQQTTISVPSSQAFNDDNTQLTERIRTLLVLMSQESGISQSTIAIETHTEASAGATGSAQSDLIALYIASEGLGLPSLSVTNLADADPNSAESKVGNSRVVITISNQP